MNEVAGRVSCELCGEDDPSVLFEGSDRRHQVPGEYTLVQCRRCGHVYMNPRPDARALEPHYPDDYVPFRERKGLFARLGMALRRHEARWLSTLLPRKARLLEIGCATGDLLGPLHARGFDVVGLEPNARAAAIARQESGVQVHTGSLGTASLGQGSFDAVIMRMVVEHLSEPGAELSRIRDLLVEGGSLIISTENVDCLERRVFGEDWYGFDVPRHLHLFTPDSLSRLLWAAGFETRDVRHALVPNYWIVSTRYALERRFGRRRPFAVLSTANPLCLAGFLPITWLQQLAGTSARFTIVARRRPSV
jgi:SAM-dependent methyltransferase